MKKTFMSRVYTHVWSCLHVHVYAFERDKVKSDAIKVEASREEQLYIKKARMVSVVIVTRQKAATNRRAESVR